MIRLNHSAALEKKPKNEFLNFTTMKNLCLLLFFFCNLSLAKSQSPDIQARILYTEAEEYYSTNNFNEAISNLDRIIQTLGQTNPKVEVLYSKSLFQLKKFEESENHLKTFFSLADESNNSFDEMIQLKVNIKKAAEQLALEKRNKEEQAQKQMRELEILNQQKLRDSKAFSEAVSYKKIGYYRSYVNQFPNGDYVDKAKHMISLWDKQKELHDEKSFYKKRLKNTLWVTGFAAIATAYGIPKLEKAGGVWTDMHEADGVILAMGVAFISLNTILILPVQSSQVIKSKKRLKAFKREHNAALQYLVYP